MLSGDKNVFILFSTQKEKRQITATSITRLRASQANAIYIHQKLSRHPLLLSLIFLLPQYSALSKARGSGLEQ